MTDAKPAWLDAHSHEPNPETPEGNGAFRFKAGEIDVLIDLDLLRAIRYTELAECTIASTGHAQTGPFRFGGVLVRDLLAALLPAKAAVIHVDFVGADGYGTRLQGSAAALSARPASRIHHRWRAFAARTRTCAPDRPGRS